jgi:hypothetical protein
MWDITDGHTDVRMHMGKTSYPAAKLHAKLNIRGEISIIVV